jgi:hypothetical protein
MIFSHQNGQVSVRTPQYRLDSRGALFDMLADPGQTKDIAAAQPAVAARLDQAVATWRKDVFGAAVAQVADAKAKGKGKGKAGNFVVPDDRPYPVGYTEFPWTPLPARDGVPHGDIRRSGNAPNCSYFVNWKSTDDRLTWDIEVNATGTYEVVVDYTCPVSDAGSLIEFSFRDAKLTGQVVPGWDPPLNTNQDTVPRPDGESQMKEFRPLSLGTVRLEKGRGQLTLRALQIPGKNVMDVRRVNLTLK